MSNVKELNINSTTYDIVGKAVVDENNAGTPIKTWTGTSSSLPVSPSSDTLYYVTDTKQILLGSTILSDGLKKTYDLFDFKWADHELNDQSWLRADTFSWQDGTVYTNAYNHLVDDIDGKTATTETIGSYTITYVLADDGHKITTDETTVANIYNESGVAWYYILDTANQRFKLPRTKYGFTGLRDTVGKYVPESLPNITGSVTNHKGGYIGSSGAFTSGGSAIFAANGNNISSNTIYLDASRSSSAYQDDAPVQERGTQMYLYFYVGQFTQTAGLNSELFNGKLDLSAANLSRAGKSLISGLGMPSTRYKDLTLGASGSTYTAPANGYYSLKCQINNAGSYIQLEADYLYSSMIAQNAGNGVSIWIPVQKGETCTFNTNANMSNVQFKFVYAQGEENV